MKNMDEQDIRMLIRTIAGVAALLCGGLAIAIGWQSISAFRAGTMMPNWHNGQMPTGYGFMLTLAFLLMGGLWFYYALFPERHPHWTKWTK